MIIKYYFKFLNEFIFGIFFGSVMIKFPKYYDLHKQNIDKFPIDFKIVNHIRKS